MRRRNLYSWLFGLILLAGCAPTPPHPHEHPWVWKWIWCEGEPRPKNFYACFRKTFDSKGGRAHIRVSADSRYQLFLNGERIARGPARCDRRWQYFDIWPVQLRPGKNVVAALVHHYGEWTFQYMLGRGGFICEGPGFATDASWKVLPAEAWARGQPRMDIQLGFNEVYDARKAPEGWADPGFDDSSWPHAIVLGPPGMEPWPSMVPRDIPAMAEGPVLTPKLIDETPYDDTPLHHIDFLPLMDRKEWAVAYVEAFIEAPDDREVEIKAGSDDAIKLWVNDELAISHLIDRGAAPDQERATVKLKKGRNRVLAKIVQGIGLWEFYFRVPLPVSPWRVCGPYGFEGKFHKIGFDEAYAPEKGEAVEWREVPQSDDLLVSRLMLGRVKGKGPGVMRTYDFGREVTGYVRLKAEAMGGEVIDLGYSEILEGGRVNPERQGVHYADRYVCKAGEQTWETFDKRAFRYLRIDSTLAVEPSLLFSSYPVEWRGSFECSDPRLNEIWRVGAYTCQLNMEDGYTDCPWRERGQWWGDARVEALINYTAFGDTKLIRKALVQKGQSQNEEGMTWGVYPTDWDGGRLPDFTLIWVMTALDYYRHTGDLELVRELMPKIERAFGFFERKTDEYWLLRDVPYWVFIDWAEIDKRGECAALNAYYYGARRAAAELARAIGDEESAERHERVADWVKRGMESRLFDGKRFRNCSEGTRTGIQENALAYLFGITDSAGVLDGPFDVESGSPYFSFYILQALYRAGRHEAALKMIRERWGAMLDAGATTWWEMWKPDSSLCHGWSGGPTYDLVSEFAGVKPAAPGWVEVDVRPHPCDLDWVKATVPSVRGPVTVLWRKGGECILRVPRGMKGVVHWAGKDVQITNEETRVGQ